MNLTSPNSPEVTRIIVLIQFAATWAMVGLIWLVQVVHYPLLRLVGSGDFKGYHHNHTRLISWVVGPPMLVEGLSAVALVWYRPAAVPELSALAGLALLIVIWASTAFLQVPQHNRLARGFDTASYRKLVATNWVRTAAWSLRGLLTAWMVWKVAR